MYGAKTRSLDKISEHIRKFPRQALHAVSLSFEQPNNKKLIDIKSDLPNDIKNLENILENE
jgi:23S rRNA-/tRNA-specific pseudouridylate synthase